MSEPLAIVLRLWAYDVPNSGSEDGQDFLNEVADTIGELAGSIEELIRARGTDPYLVIGQHPIDGHPLNAEGMAVIRADAALAKAKGGQ